MRKTRHILLMLLMLLPAAGRAVADTADTSAVAEHNDRWLDVLARSRQNPAFANTAYRSSYTELGLLADYAHRSKPFVREKGSGHLLGRAYVESYLRMGRRSVVWGGASYQAGLRRNIRYNATTDYDLLYPYVMGDTVGGKMKNEQYAFFGGYAGTMRRWTLGAELRFRAEHEFRDIDPRPRGIATDLHVDLGANVSLGHYKIGVGMGGNIYKQTNDVQFYNDLGVKPEYHMTGLGTHYVRFAGANRTCYYRGLGLTADLHLRPTVGSGAYLSAAYAHMPYEKILTELNALPISTLYARQIEGEAGWKQEGKIGWSVFGGLTLGRRNGNEHIAGNASGKEYASLITLTMYRSRQTDSYIGAAVHLAGRHRLTAEGRIGRQTTDHRYARLERTMHASGLYARVGLQHDVRIGRGLFLVSGIDVQHMANKAGRIDMPHAIMDRHATELTEDMFRVMTSNATDICGRMKLYYAPAAWKGMAAFVTIKGGSRRLPDRTGTTLETAAGIAF